MGREIMAEFDLVQAFIDAGLADKVLREWRDEHGTRWRLSLRDTQAWYEWFDRKLNRWELAIPAYQQRDIENELLRQMTEYCDERGVETVMRLTVPAGDPMGTFQVWRPVEQYLRPDGTFCTAGPDSGEVAAYSTRPEAQFAACVAIVEDEEKRPNPT